jgi:hypothetical protein
MSILLSTLNEDCLVELLSRCDTNDILKLEQTCQRLHRVSNASQVLWQRRLWADLGLNAMIGAEASPALQNDYNVVKMVTRGVYESSADQSLRFQAVLVNGGIDEDNMFYWADCIFGDSKTPWCSDCSHNADCLALLLNGVVPREEEYRQAQMYMRRRCAYAVGILEQFQNPGAAAEMTAEEKMELINSWKDVQVEQFFVGMVDRLQQGELIGRLLLRDVIQAEHEQETAKMVELSHYLEERTDKILNGMLRLPEDSKSSFDTSVMTSLTSPLSTREQLVGCVNALRISREGSLTCPVASGAVLAGVVDFGRLEGLSKEDVAAALYSASQDKACAAFNSLESEAAVLDKVHNGELPRIVRRSRYRSGVVMEFDSEWNPDVGLAGHTRSNGPLIGWKPLIWFRFHTREEATAFETARERLQRGSAVEVAATGSPVEEGEGEQAETRDDTLDVSQLGNSPHDREESEHIGTSDLRNTSFDGGEEMSNTTSDVADTEEEETDVPLVEMVEFLAEELMEDEEIEPLGGVLVEGQNENPGGDLHFDLGLTSGRNVLTVQLRRPVIATALLVKMIDQENLMQEFEDEHSWPNIDLAALEVVGKQIQLPRGVTAVPPA